MYICIYTHTNKVECRQVRTESWDSYCWYFYWRTSILPIGFTMSIWYRVAKTHGMSWVAQHFLQKSHSLHGFLFRRMTYKDKASYESSPLCNDMTPYPPAECGKRNALPRCFLRCQLHSDQTHRLLYFHRMGHAVRSPQYIIDSTENATPPKSTRSRNSNSSVQTQIFSKTSILYREIPRDLRFLIWWISKV